MGTDDEARKFLTDLDNHLVEKYNIRDMVDCVTYEDLKPFCGDAILKACCGALVERLDGQSVTTLRIA